jgi:predicted deacylase
VANPIGLAQWSLHKPIGRFETGTAQNFNRGYPDLASVILARVQGRLTDDVDANTALIRSEMLDFLSALPAGNDLAELRLTLLKHSIDADFVLDLHCDAQAVVHHYASTTLPDLSELLGRAIGSKLALLCEISGGHPFDEAHTAPWASLRRAFGNQIGYPCFATTIEYRGQFDVDDKTAAADAANLMTFLGEVGAVSHDITPQFPAAPAYPLEGYVEVLAPQGGLVTWDAAPGAWVEQGDTLCYVTNPQTRSRMPVTAPISGLMFRREMWPMCLRGQGLAHVAGPDKIRDGDLLTA